MIGKTYEEQIHNLQLVFDRIKAANLKLSPKKCEFFKRKVKFVGHIVSEEGIEIDPRKTSYKLAETSNTRRCTQIPRVC